MVKCPQAVNGCTWTGTRDELCGSHRASCAYEAIKGFFDIFARKTETMTAENVVLRRKVDALEGVVSVLTRENEGLKGALGPWCRPDIQPDFPVASSSRITAEMIPLRRDGPTTQPSQPSALRSASITNAPSSTVSPALAVNTPLASPQHHSPGGTSILPSSSRPTAHGEVADLASYFPPDNVAEGTLEEGELLEPGLDGVSAADGASSGQTETGRNRSISSSQPYPFYPDTYPYAYPSTSPYALPSTSHLGTAPISSMSSSPSHVPPVAPLNISTSLHRTLLALRDSIVTLTNAVDSLARRQDVALATEAMRTNEDIRSLRVVIHGLRMQVSWMP